MVKEDAIDEAAAIAMNRRGQHLKTTEWCFVAFLMELKKRGYVVKKRKKKTKQKADLSQ